MTPKHTKYQNRSSLSKPSLHLSLSHSSPTRRGQRPLIRILIECSSAFTFTRTIPQSRQTVHRQTASSSNAETAIRNNKNCYRDQGYLHACGGRTGLGDVLPPGLFQVEFVWGWPCDGMGHGLWASACRLDMRDIFGRFVRARSGAWIGQEVSTCAQGRGNLVPSYYPKHSRSFEMREI